MRRDVGRIACLCFCLIAGFFAVTPQIQDVRLQERGDRGRQAHWLPGLVLSDDWQRQHPIETGWNLMSVSVVDSQHAWASGWHDSAAGLVVRTTNGGDNWMEMSRTLPLFVNDIQFITASLGWIVGGDNIQRSGFISRTTDGGQSWVDQLSTPDVRFWSVFFLDETRGWVCGDSGTILATTNAGTDWQRQEGGRRRWFQDVFFLPNGTGWCGPPVLRTSNFGAQWDSVADIPLNRFSFLNDSVGWAVRGLWASSLYWQTTDGGNTWIEHLSMTNVFPTDVTMLNDSVVLATMWDSRVDPPFNDFPISLKNVARFSPPIETRAILLDAIDFTAGGHGFAVGWGNIVGSSNYGRTWRNQAGALYWSLLGIDMIDSTTGWVVGAKELILRTTDGGLHWVAQSEAASGVLSAVSSVDAQHAFACGTTFMSTSDAGQTWVRTQIPGNYEFTDLMFLDARIGWMTTNTDTILHTTDGGMTWQGQRMPSPSSDLTAVDFVDSLYGWCAGERAVFHTTNGGTDWSLQAGGFNLLEDMDFVDRDCGWILSPYLVLKTTDGGWHWDTSAVFTPEIPFTGLGFSDRDTGWIVAERGRILATTDGGTTWMVQRNGGNPGEPALMSIKAVSSNLVWTVGEGGLILRTTTGGGITAVRPQDGTPPTMCRLDQNYPNPFNAITTIRFGIESSARVSLHVYDMLGRDIAALVEMPMQPGYFEVQFDASHLSSGVYHYCLVVDKQTLVRKMLLLR